MSGLWYIRIADRLELGLDTDKIVGLFVFPHHIYDLVPPRLAMCCSHYMETLSLDMECTQG